MTCDIEKITTCFPPPAVPIIRLPTYQTIQELYVKLNVNTASIHTNIGDDNHGLLRLTVSAAQYNSVSVLFVTPTNLGATSTYSPNATTSILVKEKEAHDTIIKIFRECSLADNALKQLLLTSVEEKHFHVLRNSLISYDHITTRTLIQHLYTSYGDITSTQIADNDTQIHSPYNSNQPIESLYAQIDSDVDFAASNDNEYTAKQIVSVTYEILFHTDVYTNDCKLWRKKVNTDRTWSNFKQFFTVASQYLRQIKTTTGSVGYHVLPHDAVDITHTLNTITTAMDCDQSSTTKMTNHNHHLTSQLNLSLSGISTTTYNITALQNQPNTLTCNGIGVDGRTIGTGSSCGTSNDPTGGGGTLTGIPKNINKRHRFDFNVEPRRKVFHNENYCHTHRYHVTDGHTSPTHKHQAERYKTTAMRTHVIGGCTRGAFVCLWQLPTSTLKNITTVNTKTRFSTYVVPSPPSLPAISKLFSRTQTISSEIRTNILYLVPRKFIHTKYQ